MTTQVIRPSMGRSSACKRTAGFTLTEIAIVLGIIGLILGAVWAAAKNVYANTNQTKALQIASVLVANVRAQYAQSQPTSGDLSAPFSNMTFTASTGNIVPDIVGQTAVLGGSPIAGFVLDFASGISPGGKLGVTSSDIALCQGISQLAQSVTGAMVSTSTTASTSSTFTPNCTCPTGTTSMSSAVTTSYIVGSNNCQQTAGKYNGNGYCTGIPVSVCNAVGANTPIQVFVPWQS